MKIPFDRLWVRLSLAFILVTQLSIFIVAALADASVNGAFQRYVMISSSGQITDSLIQFYDQTGSWTGVESVLSSPRANQIEANPAGLTAPSLPPMLLADSTGTIIYDSSHQQTGVQLSAGQQAQAIPLSDTNLSGKVFGYLLPKPAQTTMSIQMVKPGSDTAFFSPPMSREQEFLDRMHRTLVIASLVIGILGIVAALVISRMLVAPLTQLSEAARAFAARDWTNRVTVRGSREVAAVALAFNEMADDLQKGETLRRDLIADIAHELRTPLSVMQANLRALLDGLYPMDEREIAILYEETCTLSHLVGDLRELAQADSGQLELNLGILDVAAILEGMAARFAVVAEGDGTRVCFEAAGDDFRVRADGDRLTQILGNLLSNALRHTPAGTITLSAERLPARPRQPAQVRITVCDTGGGIPAADLIHVFDRFYRVDRSRTRSSGNSGLGLAIAKAWVEAMGGQIGAESEPGKGSRFWFALPIA